MFLGIVVDSSRRLYAGSIEYVEFGTRLLGITSVAVALDVDPGYAWVGGTCNGWLLLGVLEEYVGRVEAAVGMCFNV